MKIISFAVDNFRPINGRLENNKITFEGSNTIFIFGQNNVGKSTFLKAYEFFVKDTNPSKQDHYNQSEENKICFEIVIEIEDKDEKFIEQSKLSQYQNFCSKKDSKNRIHVRKTWTDKKWQFETFNHENNEWEKGQSFGLGKVFGSVLPKPIFIKAMPSEDDVKKTINEILQLKAQRYLKSEEIEELETAKQTIQNLQNKMYGQVGINNYNQKVNQEFQKLFPDLDIEIVETDKAKFTPDKIGKDFDITCKNKKNQNEEFDLPEGLLSHGHGTIRTAIFTFCMLQDEASKDSNTEIINKDVLILFEEPELFLHPKLTKILRNLMYETSKSNSPYQVLCASHSPQMIDISKKHTSLVRIVQETGNNTKLHQIQQVDIVEKELKSATKQREEAKQKLQEILRFNPFICESFYADEVVLVEGDTEAIIWRAYLDTFPSEKDIFVINCGGPGNIPFYQRIFSKFNIKYSVICDTDDQVWNNDFNNAEFTTPTSNQGKIQIQFKQDKEDNKANKFFVFEKSFEPAHERLDNPFKYKEGISTNGKPLSANNYWNQIIAHKDEVNFSKIPIIKYIKTILEE